jgi:hypothetical protein
MCHMRRRIHANARNGSKILSSARS